MKSRQTDWPRQWLMTDERMGDRLWTGIDRLPSGHSGIVFRHYATSPDTRAALARRIADTCRRRGLTLAVAVDEELARSVEADLVHNPARRPIDLPFSRSVHSLAEAEAARSDGAALVFVSPVRPTRSHVDQKPLGRPLALRIAQAAAAPAIALGGMTELNSREFIRAGFHGWAGIDAWLTGESA